MGSMKSNSRTSPGVGVGISSVTVDDLDMIRTSLCPYKKNPPLLVDPNTVFAGPIAFEGLEAIVRWHRQISQHLGVVQHPKLSERGVLDIVRQGAAEMAVPNKLSLGRSKADDHLSCITSCVIGWQGISSDDPQFSLGPVITVTDLTGALISLAAMAIPTIPGKPAQGSLTNHDAPLFELRKPE
jgi:hypothetical protein